MKKIIRTFSLMLFLAYTIYSQTPPPVLYFSDITSGPKTGNSDNSLGQTPGQDGAIVTIWGRNFSSGNADVKIFCNGMQSQFIYYRGPANIGANLVPYHKMEMISFQIDNLANDGLGSIYVEVNGVISNSIPFTVRPGNIYYVKTTGNDNSGNGSWTNPWGTIVNGKDNLAPGDILYVCDGVNQTTEENFEGCVVLSSDGTPGNPKSLIVYPNATSIVGDTSIKRAFHPYNVEDRPSIHWVISKFRLFTADEGVSARTGFRVIGNFLSAPDGSSADAAIGCRGDDIYIYGNELYDVGSLNCDKLYHGIYVTGNRKGEAPRLPIESNHYVAWNYLHDNNSNRGINGYSEEDYSAFVQNNYIHDNVIINQRGDGIFLGYYIVGENQVYNNLVIRAGLGPDFIEGNTSTHLGIRIDLGHTEVNNTVIYCYNNTIYGCGWNEAVFEDENGHFQISRFATDNADVFIRNNIIYSTGETYIADRQGDIPSAQYNNCWYGNGEPPAWDINAVNTNPLFIDPGNSNFQLNSGSPCIDKGQDVSSIVKRDLLGVQRPSGKDFDIGAYELDKSLSVDDDNLLNNYDDNFFSNYPNPCNQTTTFSFTLKSTSSVRIAVYNIYNQLVIELANNVYDEGENKIKWVTNYLPDGVYFGVLCVNNIQKAIRKMIIMK